MNCLKKSLTEYMQREWVLGGLRPPPESFPPSSLRSSSRKLSVFWHRIKFVSTCYCNSEEFQFLPANEPEVCFRTVIDRYIKEVNRVGIENACILCPMKSRGLNCVKEYNERIQAMINPPAPNKAEIQLKNSVFRVGDRIMQTKNSNDVCNGETGFIMEIKKDEDDIQICGIRFDGRNDVLWYYPEELQYITLSYAITIHKSQGSEFKSVIIPLLKSYYIMLKRNLLYTAVTRAKSKVILVGERQAGAMRS